MRIRFGVCGPWGIACLLTVGLAGCGGGGSGDLTGTGATASGTVWSTQSYEQPATAQGETTGQVKRRSEGLGVSTARVTLGPISEAKALSEAPVVGARQIGLSRTVADTATVNGVEQLLQWRNTASGGLATALSISATGAHGLRIGLLVQQLPETAILRVYRQDQPSTVYEISGAAVLRVIARNLESGDRSAAARTWWTPDTGGDEVTLEVELPAGVRATSVKLAVPQVSHFFADLSLPVESELAQQAKINESNNCNLDATCHDSYANLRNAVARMIFTSEGLSYVCTGTLLNDRDTTGTPYFISANHCISSQTVASTLQTDWFYRSPSCNSRTLSSSTVKRRGGATLLYASESTDTSFLKLLDAPPAGATFAGWDANVQALSGAVVGVHHPQGDLLKISFGAITAQSSCSSVGGNQFACSGTNGNFYRVNWSQGLTEGGSSGSAIFRGNALVGTLYGGGSSCFNSADFYGRFDVAYASALKEWLSPGAAGTPDPAPTTPSPLQNWINQLQNLAPVSVGAAMTSP